MMVTIIKFVLYHLKNLRTNHKPHAMKFYSNKLYLNNNTSYRMKYLNPIIAITLLLFAALPTKAQLDSCNIFLKGNYIEVGQCQNGGYGSTINAPISYVARPTNPAGGQ